MRKRVEQGTTTERGQKNWNKNFWQTLVIELSKCQTLRGYFCYFFSPFKLANSEGESKSKGNF